jgi:hypothetical protein
MKLNTYNGVYIKSLNTCGKVTAVPIERLDANVILIGTIEAGWCSQGGKLIERLPAAQEAWTSPPGLTDTNLDQTRIKHWIKSRLLDRRV